MRFSGPELPTTTPCAFDSIGIIKTVKEKMNAPSARRIMDCLRVFRLPDEQVCQAGLNRRNALRKSEIIFYEKDILK